VFPTDFKAAPLLRAWLRRLRQAGVGFHMRHRWSGWDEQGTLRFTTPEGNRSVRADAVVLALGGGSWRSQTDARGPLLAGRGLHIAPLTANCGFDVGWSEHFRQSLPGIRQVGGDCCAENRYRTGIRDSVITILVWKAADAVSAIRDEISEEWPPCAST
jgi:predicted flavoprotein YhiN